MKISTKDFCEQHAACPVGREWALAISDDMAVVWDAMVSGRRFDWLIWTATRRDVFPDSTLRLLACRFARETPLADGRTVWDLLTDPRSRAAIETAERHARGEATDEEMAAAGDAAAAWAWAADGAAARAAARAADGDADAHASWAAARAAAWAAARAADASWAAARDAAWAAARDADAAEAADAARDAARAAQIQMVSDLGNPFN